MGDREMRCQTCPTWRWNFAENTEVENEAVKYIKNQPSSGVVILSLVENYPFRYFMEDCCMITTIF